MKKIYLSILSLMVAAGAIAQTAVTFNVTFPLGDASPDGVHVAGNFYDNNYDGTADNPAYMSATSEDGNWDPNVPALTLSDAGAGTYTLTLNLVAGRYEFKFINGNNWASAENVPQTCTVDVNGNSNRQIMVGSAATSYSVCYGECAECGENAIRLRVDMSTVDLDADGVFAEPGEDISPLGVHVNGSFVNWTTFVPLQDWDNNNIWETTITTATADPIQYKFINGNDWNTPILIESVGAPCGDGQNRLLTITDPNTVVPVFCWNSCDPCSPPVDVTFQVDLSNFCFDASQGIELMGSAAPLSWGSGLAMNDDDGNGIWSLTLGLSPGVYEYKFRAAGVWEEVTGLAGNRTLTVIANTPLTLPVVCFASQEPCVPPLVGPADVTFEVNAGDADLQPDQVMWVMGNFTYPNWQSGAVQMTDIDGDGTWTVTVPQVCAEVLEYKFRYGAANATEFVEESADFSSIGGCGEDNGQFSDNRVLSRTDSNPVSVCWRFNLCESCLPASLDESKSASNIRVFPVPAEDQLNVQFDAPVAQRMTVRMVNSLGQAVVEENLGVVYGQKTISLNTTALSAGVYALTLNNGSQTQVVNVMIK